jgi:hypothetical protein
MNTIDNLKIFKIKDDIKFPYQKFNLNLGNYANQCM